MKYAGRRVAFITKSMSSARGLEASPLSLTRSTSCRGRLPAAGKNMLPDIAHVRQNMAVDFDSIHHSASVRVQLTSGTIQEGIVFCVDKNSGVLVLASGKHIQMLSSSPLTACETETAVDLFLPPSRNLKQSYSIISLKSLA